MARAHTLALLAIVLVGIAVRVAIFDQSLFGDELFTSYVTEPDGLGGVLDRVREIESNPPLFSVLAWGGAQLGHPEIWIRLPSLIAGIALIPLVGALGTLLRGPGAGLTAAALVALSPFSTFFATEARAYATMTFLVGLATLALLCALGRRGRWWWAVFVLAAVAALYTHYTTAFPLGVQAVWALWQHRDRVRALLLTHGLAVLLFLPWIPLIRENEAEQAIGGAFDLTPGSALSAMLRLVFGHAIESFDELPGTAGVVLLVLAGAAAAAGLAARRRLAKRPAGSGPAPRARHPRGGGVLVAALLLATPLGLLAYDVLGGGDLYLPRNLSASLPALVVGLAWLVWSLPRRFATAAAVLLVAAAAVGTLQLVTDDDHARPAFRTIAKAIDDRARPADSVVSSPLFFIDPGSPLHRGLEVQLHRDHALFRVERAQRRGGVAEGVTDPRAWAVPRGGRVFVAGYEQPGTFRMPRPPAGARGFREVSRRTYPGLTRLTLVVYERG